MVNQAYFEKWSEIAKKVQEPVQAIAELNVKTLQNLSYIKPDELANLKKPEELFDKQMNIALENGHKALDYMQKSFQIIEKAMLNFAKDVKKTEQAVK
ncbi:phasin family protein [Legionella taurinensis]|nr:phasin family protein [Legionella taurinensis]MDX1837868.1 phasin family protein [Legionella taurinensis]STY25028.1 Phasin protein [Legionella taurinensis]